MAISVTQAFMGVDNSVIKGGVLAHLYNNDITNIMTATAGNPDTMDAGTALFYTGDMLQVDAYTQQGYTKNPQIVAEQAEVLLNKKRSVRWSVETLDRNTFKDSAELENLIAGSLGNSIIAERSADLTKAVVDTAIAQGNYLVLANANTATQEADLRELYFAVTDQFDDIDSIINKKAIGEDKNRINVISTGKLRRRLLKEMSQAANEGAQRTGDLTQIDGVNIAKSILLGQDLTAGQSFSKDKAYSFGSVAAAIFNTGSMVAPMGNMQTAGSIDADGNPNYTAKYIVNEGTALRPEYVRVILTAEPTPAMKESAKKALIAQFKSISTIEVAENLEKSLELKEKFESKKESKQPGTKKTAGK